MLSIHIIAFHKFAQTLKCLESVRSCVRREYEVILVENGTASEAQRETLRALASEWREMKLVELDTSRHCPWARSRVLDHARGEHIFFLDNDCFIEEDIFGPLLDLLGDNPEVGGVAPALLYHPSRTLQCLGISLQMNDNGTFHPRHMHHDEPWGNHCHAEPFESEFIPGGCSLFTREFLCECRYDQGLKNIMGDFDLCLQGRDKGYRYMFHPGVKVLHDKTTNHEGYLEAKARLTDWLGGVRRFREKWGLLYYIYPEYEQGRIELFLGQFPIWKPRASWPENLGAK
jgi:GT2 family glycosyltransferase